MFIAANDQISIEHFGKAGENAACRDDQVHLWGNCLDGGLKINFRQPGQKIKKISASVRGTVRFNSEWGRFRFEGYDQNGRLIHVDEFSPREFPTDPENFRPFLIDLGPKRLALKKAQFIFLGPAMIDLAWRDITVDFDE
jgi:hypothetical protein